MKKKKRIAAAADQINGLALKKKHAAADVAALTIKASPMDLYNTLFLLLLYTLCCVQREKRTSVSFSAL